MVILGRYGYSGELWILDKDKDAPFPIRVDGYLLGWSSNNTLVFVQTNLGRVTEMESGDGRMEKEREPSGKIIEVQIRE